MAQDRTRSSDAAAADHDSERLRKLANDFLDLWQENLLAWASDPALSPALPPPSGTQPGLKAPPDDA